MPIGNITLTPELATIRPSGAAGAQQGGFAEMLGDYLKDANATMVRAQDAASAFAAGESNNIHETMLAAEEAAISLRLVGSIRNNLLDAYREIMRMNV
jgi:flagellar hook-basal body complex protein FliE